MAAFSLFICTLQMLRYQMSVQDYGGRAPSLLPDEGSHIIIHAG
jgi:hypothetical protein